MKVVIVGATGFIGSAILKRALVSPSITSIVTLSRRALPSDVADDRKLTNVLVQDFTAYSPDVLEALKGAEVCICYFCPRQGPKRHRLPGDSSGGACGGEGRSLGGRVPQFANYEEARNANVVYLHAGAKAMVEHVASTLPKGKKFRFVYCSGMFTEYDQNKKLAFLEQSRKLKGEAEVGLIEIEKASPESFELFIGRPAGVLETDKGLANILYGSMGIGKGELAAAMVDIAEKGAENQISDSKALRARGRTLLKSPSS